MRESSERQQRKTLFQSLSYQGTQDGARMRKAMSERCAAVRRWIDDDDDPACRGID